MLLINNKIANAFKDQEVMNVAYINSWKRVTLR